MSAYAGKEEEARCAELGVNVFLPKPIIASSFFDAIMEAEGAGARIERRQPAAPLAREYQGVKALLAEDNDANQMVATELLSRLGIELDIASNGREAVEMAKANPAGYVCVLMDMQMPEMDGLERDAGDPGRPGVARPADHRHDGERDEGRPRRVPGGRDERHRHEAHRSRRARLDAAQVAARVGEGHRSRRRRRHARRCGRAGGPCRGRAVS